MLNVTFTVRDENGLHARPAATVSKTLAEYQCLITVRANGYSADAKKLVSLMKLRIKQGDEVAFYFDGVDADRAKKATEKVWALCGL